MNPRDFFAELENATQRLQRSPSRPRSSDVVACPRSRRRFSQSLFNLPSHFFFFYNLFFSFPFGDAGGNQAHRRCRPIRLALPPRRAELRNVRSLTAWIYVVIVGALLSIGLFMLGRYGFRGSFTSSGRPTKSIAVLPFENATCNADTEYLSDGISEALINSLTELQQLKVIARSTAFRYKGKQIDPQSSRAGTEGADSLNGSRSSGG